MSEHIIDWDENLVIDTFSKNSLREEIVRCRDCRHYHDTYNSCVKFGDVWHDRYATVDPEGFCAWGERRVN